MTALFIYWLISWVYMSTLFLHATHQERGYLRPSDAASLFMALCMGGFAMPLCILEQLDNWQRRRRRWRAIRA